MRSAVRLYRYLTRVKFPAHIVQDTQTIEMSWIVVMKKWLPYIAAVLAVLLLGTLIYAFIRYTGREETISLALQYLEEDGHHADLEHFTFTIEDIQIFHEPCWKIVLTEIPGKDGKYLNGWTQRYAVFMNREAKALVRIGLYR